jgi:hypothetical protein
VQMEYWGRRDGRRPLESPILRSDSTLGDLSEVFFGAMKRQVELGIAYAELSCVQRD